MLALFFFFFQYKWKKEIDPVENFPSNISKETCLSGYNTQILDDTASTFYLLGPQCTWNMKQTLVQKLHGPCEFLLCLEFPSSWWLERNIDFK